MTIRTIQQLIDKFGPGDSPRSADYVDLIETLADDRNAVYFGEEAPEDTFANPIWFNTINETLFIYSDNEWIAAGGSVGNDGDSAYEIAVANGFIGTEAQWLDSLIGEQGLAGSTGATGPQGPQGDSGVVSATSPLSYNAETQTLSVDLSSYYTANQTDSAVSLAISNLIDSAPSTLNTLNELAAALGDDPDFAGTIVSELGLVNTALDSKAPKNSPTFTGTVALPADTSVGNTSSTELGYLDGVSSGIQGQLDGKANLAGATFTGEVQVQPNSYFGHKPTFTLASANRRYFTFSAPNDTGVLAFAAGSVAGTSLTGLIEFHDISNTSSTAGTRDAYIAVFQQGSSANNLGSRMDFATKSDGVSGGGTPRMTIQGNGQITGNFAAQIFDKSANYAIVVTDAGQTIRSTGSAITITIDNVLNIGDRVDFIQDGAGQITFTPGSGVTLNSVDNKRKTNKQYAGATILCVAAGQYRLIGDIVA
jgi:hypothetical protein